MKITALAGGVGGAKLVDGLYRCLPPENLTVIVNTGDDFNHFGLRVCPDLDTICYTLAGLANPVTGWGLQDETWQAMGSVAHLGGPTWFNLGDRDLGTHLERSRRLLEGIPLSQITHSFCTAWEITSQILPMTDGQVSTVVHTTEDGDLSFQEYFVKRKCDPAVKGFLFKGIERADPAPGVIESIQAADYVIICPSNPWVSIGPILAFQEIQEALANKTVIAVSPIIGGRAVKGPAAKMYHELGYDPSALTVAKHYGKLLSGFVLDQVDDKLSKFIDQSGIISLVTNTIMTTVEERIQLAKEIIQFCKENPWIRRMVDT